MGCGCSIRIAVIFGLIVLALGITGFLIGPIGSTIFHIQAPSFLAVATPEVELPAEGVFHVSAFTITNTLIASWLTIIVLGLLFYFATRKMKLIPGGLQNFAEFIIESLLNFVTGVAGEKNARIIFPVMATIFLYVLTNAFLALLPIFGTIGIYEHGGTFVPILRAANTDINLPLSIALVSFCCIEYWGLRSLGFFHYSKNFFNLEPLRDGFASLFRGKIKPAISGIMFGFINIFVGFIEVLSHLIRIVSFTFRLFGNMTAGEILLLVITFIVPFSISVIFYGLEMLVGFVQALIFAGLTLVFGVIAMASHSEEPEHAN
ncbi:MAG TPA: F0F1 ATP synthase subunit A [Dehalococcoidia bacterium]|jgi:F-type H+-transporting ATPase subunit a